MWRDLVAKLEKLEAEHVVVHTYHETIDTGLLDPNVLAGQDITSLLRCASLLSHSSHIQFDEDHLLDSSDS